MPTPYPNCKQIKPTAHEVQRLSRSAPRPGASARIERAPEYGHRGQERTASDESSCVTEIRRSRAGMVFGAFDASASLVALLAAVFR